MQTDITVIGGGLAGLTAAIAATELGAAVHLVEAHDTLGGRARSTTGLYVANEGPHAFYSDGAPYEWLAARNLVQPVARPTPGIWAGTRFLHGGQLTATRPIALLRMLADRGAVAPVEADFGTWAGRRYGQEAVRAASGLLGVATYTADVAGLSAAFVWERLQRVASPGEPVVRYPIGGWSSVVARMAAHAQSLDVRITTGTRVHQLRDRPVIVATGLDAARSLVGDATLRWPSGHAVLLDLGLRAEYRDVFLVVDLDTGGFVEHLSLVDSSIAPAGHALIQAMMPVRAGESRTDALARLEGVLDHALPGWRGQVDWRREATARGRTGALDLPGRHWRNRPAVSRGDGVWLAGDSVAAPGLLSEVAVNSARQAAESALQRTAALPGPMASGRVDT
jgi:phytoene dehydrogenase-like protein